jgi:hypothetical protein
MAIGNNAKFVIGQGAKLIIDETCQLEIEWDGASVTPNADGTMPENPDILNNGILDLRAGGEIVNNGIITIEGTEGKPYQETTKDQVVNSDKGCGEMVIDPGATLTNNGAFMVYGKLYNLGTLVNNGQYEHKIISNDPDKGKFAYPRGIFVSWKDDITQQNVVPGAIHNGVDAAGTKYADAQLVNNGDIVLSPGKLENYATVTNAKGARILLGAQDKALIPIEPPTPTSTQTTKWVTVNPPRAGYIDNYGTLLNNGSILPCTINLENNGSYGAMFIPGDHPDLFTILNHGTIINNGTIYKHPDRAVIALLASVKLDDGTVINFYSDWSFQMLFTDGGTLSGSYTFYQNMLVFVLLDGTVVEPPKGTATEGDPSYSFPASSGRAYDFTLSADFVNNLHSKVKT